MDTERNADKAEGHAEGRTPSEEPWNLQSIQSPAPQCYMFLIVKIKKYDKSKSASLSVDSLYQIL